MCRSPRRMRGRGFSPAWLNPTFPLNPALPSGQWKFYGIRKMQAGPTARCVCVFARKGIVTAKLLAFNEPKARTKKGRFPCLGMHLLTCVYIQLSLRTGGLVPWFAEFAVQPVARTYLLVQEETRRCVTACFVQVTLEGRTRTPCLAAGFMEGEATVRLCHQLNPPRIP